MDSPDLQFKYQKLAFEYSKLRAQNQVLKKGVIEEQEKSNQLKDDLKLRNQNLRKAEQEIDSLSFRNQQLTKRLTLLQDDLEIIKNKPRKGRTKLDSQFSIPHQDNNVYAEELESKIGDNARLHAELTDLEVFYKSKVAELEVHLEEASRATKYNEDAKTNEQRLQNEIKKLQSERLLQEGNAQQKEAKIIVLEKQLKSFNEINKRVDENAQQRPCSLEKLPTNLAGSVGRKPPDFGHIEVTQVGIFKSVKGVSSPSGIQLMPPCRSRQSPSTGTPYEEMSTGKFVLEMTKPMKDVSLGFYEFFVAYSTLLRESPSISSSHLKIIDYLLQEKNTWSLLYQRFEEMFSGMEKDDIVRLEDLKGVNEFSKAYQMCSSSLRRLLPVLSEKIVCFHDSQSGAAWSSTLSRIVSCFAAVSPYLSSLAAYSDGRTSMTAVAVRKILHFLYDRICKLHSTSQELLTILESLNVGDEKGGKSIKKSLSNTESSLHKVISIFGENFIQSPDESRSSDSPVSAYGRSPGTPISGSHQVLAYFGTYDNNGIGGSINDSDQVASSETCLTQQLAQATSRLAKLEEEREHWRLECQLLNHRLAKESSIVSEVIVGHSTTDEREKEIRNHFTNRCSQLYMQLTSCISQAALYQNEGQLPEITLKYQRMKKQCENLLKRMSVLEDTKFAAEKEVEKESREKTQIQEALTTTSRNYEEQISTMSDHLADLNEKIALQADTILQLKFELKKKPKK